MKYFILFSFYFLMSCSNTENILENVNVDVSSDKLSMKDVFSKIEFIGLKMGGDLLGRPFKLLVHENRYLVFDYSKHVIHVFDESGFLEFTIDRNGEGPNTYISIADFSVNPYNNDIEILAYPDQFFVFDSQGVFKSSTSIGIDQITDVATFHKFFRVTEAVVAFYQNAMPTDQIYLYSFDEKSFTYSGIPSLDVNRTYNYSPFQVFYRDKGENYFFNNENNKIYKMSENGTTYKCRITFGDLDFDIENYSLDARGLSMFQFTDQENIVHPLYMFGENNRLLMYRKKGKVTVAFEGKNDNKAAKYFEISDMPSGPSIIPFWPFSDFDNVENVEYGLIFEPNQSLMKMFPSFLNEKEAFSFIESQNPVIIKYYIK